MKEVLNHIWKCQKVNPVDIENFSIYESMYSSEPVVTLWSVFDMNFILHDQRAYIDMYGNIDELPVNQIHNFFLPCHVQHCYLIDIGNEQYFYFNYNFDTSPFSDKRSYLLIKGMIIVLDSSIGFSRSAPTNLMGLLLAGCRMISDDSAVFTCKEELSIYDALIKIIDLMKNIYKYDWDKLKNIVNQQKSQFSLYELADKIYPEGAQYE